MKKKYYLVLDTETCTLPYADTICFDADAKKKIAIAKPLVYNIAWNIMDRKGISIKKADYLVQETFFVPSIFDTAYYKAKKPIYMDMLAKGEITCKCWNDIMTELENDLAMCEISCAYNACFDFKKALPFTESYIDALYGSDFATWEANQKKSCDDLLIGIEAKNPDYLNPYLHLNGNDYPIADIWGMACDTLLHNGYKNYCLKNNLITPSKLYFKTSAESCYQYFTRDTSFTESHTALSDAEIESIILKKILHEHKVEPNVTEFPFKKLGYTYDYVINEKPCYTDMLKDEIEAYYVTLVPSGWKTRIENIYYKF